MGHTLNTLRNGEEDAGDEGLAVVRLLEDLDLLPKTRTGMQIVELACRPTAEAQWSSCMQKGRKIGAKRGGCYHHLRAGLLVLEGLELDGLDVCHDCESSGLIVLKKIAELEERIQRMLKVK